MLNEKMRSRSFSISTFGCKVNQYESQVIRERLLGLGCREDVTNPDLIVINSCAVTARAEAKVRKEIRRHLRKGTKSRLVLMGCGLTYSASQNRDLWELVPPYRRGHLPDGNPMFASEKITFSAQHGRAFIKIQDGCDSFCSYCIIPYLRGKPVSRSPEDIIREIFGLIDGGYHEIVLTGINMGKYGEDLPGNKVNLVYLLENLLGHPGNFRIRLSSIEPKEISPHLIRLIGKEKKICPHLHIPFQSGSDYILGKMNRNYTVREYVEIIKLLRETNPGISISTDCLVGFPGEDERDFQASTCLIRQVGFSKVHIFPYSRRNGTVAANYTGLKKNIIINRVKILRKISQGEAIKYRRKFLGKEVEIISEKKSKNGLYSGIDRHYNRVWISGGVFKAGEICRVKVSGMVDDGLTGCCPNRRGRARGNYEKITRRADEGVP